MFWTVKDFALKKNNTGFRAIGNATEHVCALSMASIYLGMESTLRCSSRIWSWNSRMSTPWVPRQILRRWSIIWIALTFAYFVIFSLSSASHASSTESMKTYKIPLQPCRIGPSFGSWHCVWPPSSGSQGWPFLSWAYEVCYWKVWLRLLYCPKMSL